MTLTGIIFYFFISVAAAAVVGILITKNIFKATLFLLICLLCIAGIYVIYAAAFVAVAQILIYAGGIVVVLIFGIMLTTKISGKPLVITNANIFSGSLVGVAMLLLLINILPNNIQGIYAKAAPDHDPEHVGINLMTTYSLPFEVAGILLLVALIGAAVTTSFMKSKNT
jgi:NADH:ubiquinone oxidoreductase subunit 6 (subunit J)